MTNGLSKPSGAETALAGGIVALMVAAGLAIKGATLMLLTNVLSNYTNVLEPVGFLPSVLIVLLFAILRSSAQFGD